MQNFRDCSQLVMTREPVHHHFPCAAANIHTCNKFKRLRIFPSCHALFPYSPLLFIMTSMRKKNFLLCSPRRSLRACIFVNPSGAGRGENTTPCTSPLETALFPWVRSTAREQSSKEKGKKNKQGCRIYLAYIDTLALHWSSLCSLSLHRFLLPLKHSQHRYGQVLLPVLRFLPQVSLL